MEATGAVVMFGNVTGVVVIAASVTAASADAGAATAEAVGEMERRPRRRVRGCNDRVDLQSVRVALECVEA